MAARFGVSRRGLRAGGGSLKIVLPWADPPLPCACFVPIFAARTYIACRLILSFRA